MSAGYCRYVQECIADRVAPSALFESPGFRCSCCCSLPLPLLLLLLGLLLLLLLLLTGFLLDYVALDSMHCGDLGVFQDAMGGLLFLEMANKAWHRNYAAGVQWLNKELGKFYAANRGLSQMHLTVNMLKGKNGGPPSLSSKAAECRHLAGFAVAIAHLHAYGGAGRGPFTFASARLGPYSAEYRVLIVAMATCLQSYHDICQAEPFDAPSCRASMHGFLVALCDLRLLVRRGLAPELQGGQPFPVRPKAHMLEHLVVDKIQLWLSPKNFWCYADEVFVGVIKRIAVQTKHSNPIVRLLSLIHI